MFLQRPVRGVLLSVALCIVLLASRSSALAFTGNEWRSMSQPERLMYVAGVMDAWFNVAAVTKVIKQSDPTHHPGIVERILAQITDCTQERMTYQQSHAIVEKYMNQNPESWHQDMASITWAAMSKACSAR